jgi:hypothetical protein
MDDHFVRLFIYIVYHKLQGLSDILVRPAAKEHLDSGVMLYAAPCRI